MWDQGTEMAWHASVTVAADLLIYFADLHSRWERPTNENSNGLIRDYVPKGEEIPRHQPYLDAISAERGERPWAVLGFSAAREAFEKLLLADLASTG